MHAVIIGNGVVGKATAKALEIRDYIDVRDSNVTYEQAVKAPYIFLCLPTPTVNGTCNLTSIKRVVRKLADVKYKGTVVIRSTVTPGTAQVLAEQFDLVIVSNPEFLKWKTANHDTMHPEMIVIGENHVGQAQRLVSEYSDRFPKAKMIISTTTTAETIKYAFNNFLTLKIVYANEIYDLCVKIGADYDYIKEALQSHSSGTKTHLVVLHEGGRGGGGYCLPKDTQAFATFSKSRLIRLVNDLNNQLLAKYPKDD